MEHVQISNQNLANHARSLAALSSVSARHLALAFDETVATTANLHVEGRNFYPSMLSDIREASSSVHMNLFGFWPGHVGEQFVDVIVAKARENVPIRLIVDSRGTGPDGRSRGIFERMARAGVQILVNRGTQLRVRRGRWGSAGEPRWNLDGLTHIDHRKVIIVDGRIGWVGGGGIADHFENSEFLDLFVRVEGPIVSQLQLVFVAGFRWLGGDLAVDEISGLFPNHEPGMQQIPATVLHNAPGRFRPISQSIADTIDAAQETLDVVNPYVTDRSMIRRIEHAAMRGVRTRLFVPAHSNHPNCAAAEQFHHARLLDAGVEILGHPQMLHAKALVADNQYALVGSCNLDAMSLKRFFELNLSIHSRDLAVQFEERILAPAELVSSPLFPPNGPMEHVRAAVFSALSPLL